MNQSESITKLMPALIEAKKEMGVVNKSEQVSYGNKYTYATLEDYLDIIAPALSNNSLCVVTGNPTAIQLADRGREHPVQVELIMTLLHASGEYIQISVCGQAQDVGDKAVYQAITGARKYGLACLFNLVTSDDPERTGKKSNGEKKEQAPQVTSSPAESTKPDPQKTIKLEIHTRLCEMYGQDYAEKGTLERITEWDKGDGTVIPGIKSLREKVSDKRLGVIRGKVSVEYKKFKESKEKPSEEPPFRGENNESLAL